MLFVFKDEKEKRVGIAFKPSDREEYVSAWLPVQECLGLSAQLAVSALSMHGVRPDYDIEKHKLKFCWEVSGYQDIVLNYETHSPLEAADRYCSHTDSDYSVLVIKLKRL